MEGTNMAVLAPQSQNEIDDMRAKGNGRNTKGDWRILEYTQPR